MKELFNPGRIHCSAGVDMEFACRNINPLFFLIRHVNGDWGDVDIEEWQENESALASYGRLFSRYTAPFGEIWIITTADRTETYMCFPHQYMSWVTGLHENDKNAASTLRQPPFENPSSN
jgi:hypothetical protein